MVEYGFLDLKRNLSVLLEVSKNQIISTAKL